jgi:sugar/nucleoside kinase (ribokinase family)
MASYRQLIGAGAIGHGIAFELEGNETLGRNESRLGHLLPTRDFCKLHIICHYLGRFLGERYPIHLVSAVGEDEAGEKLIQEIRDAHLKADFIQKTPDFPTPYCVCFQYPDKSGGNITEGSSSALCVTPEVLDQALDALNQDGQSIILAAPEITLVSQSHLLKQATETGAFTASTSISEQLVSFKTLGGIAHSDLFAINIDEARTLAGLNSGVPSTEAIVEGCVEVCKRENPDLHLIITLGSDGLVAVSGDQSVHLPTIKVNAIATAGAGDALLAGTLIGLWEGLPFLPGPDYATAQPLSSAVELGMAMASLSVTSADTIHFGINPGSLFQHIKEQGLSCSPQMEKLFHPHS